MSAQKPSKKVKLSVDKSTEIIKEYCQGMTRPYSLVDIISNTKGVVGKSTAVKIIESLVEDGKLLSKVSIFWLLL